MPTSNAANSSGKNDLSNLKRPPAPKSMEMRMAPSNVSTNAPHLTASKCWPKTTTDMSATKMGEVLKIG